MNSLDAIFWIFTGFAFVLGTVVGSFLNVVIYRVPAGLSIVHPPSRCPVCEQPIRWYDNIPIFSWAVLLRGKCRNCATPIPARYALVEGLTGVLTAALWFKIAHPAFATVATFEQTPAINYLLPFGLYFVFVCLMVVITFVDLDHFLIPHRFTLPGMVLGVATPLLFNFLLGPGSLSGFWPPVTIWESVIGLVLGGGAVVVIFYGYFAIRGVAGIGGGDVTLMAVVGAWLGWPSVIFVFFAASLQGTIAAGIAMLAGGGLVRNSAELFEEDEDEEPAGADAEAAPVADAPVRADMDADIVVDLEAPDAASVEASDDGADAQAGAPAAGGLAVPFGPFIALAALEHLFLGNLLPAALSMSYLYQFGSW